jgi:AcrR family transcriptional regulator
VSNRERQRRETRQRLYQAALSIFRDRGVAGARIDEIAQLAGVSRGTFYFHYPSKEDVLVQLMQESQLHIVERLDALSEDAPIDVVLHEVARGMADLWQQEPRMLAEIGMVALRRTAKNLSEIDGSHPVQVALVPWFERSADRGDVGALIPPVLLSEFFLVNLFGAALAWCGNPVVPLHDLLGNVVRFFLRAASVDPTIGR